MANGIRNQKTRNESSLLVAIINALITIIWRCYKATRFASKALALPITLLKEERTSLSADSEYTVPMLSVQSVGCAGMERLGVPTRTSIQSPTDDRGHIARRMRVDAMQTRDILVRESDRQVSRNNNHHHHNHHYHRSSAGCGGGNGIANNTAISNNSNSDNCIRCGFDSATSKMTTGQHLQTTADSSKKTTKLKSSSSMLATSNYSVIRCPHHVPLPDSEYGQDRDLQIRSQYQQSEIICPYIKPPPNKTVSDVPEQTNNKFYLSSSLSSANFNNQHSNNYYYNHQYQQQQMHQHQQQQLLLQQQQQQKSKPNVITKLFSSKKSSPKSPTSMSSSSSSSLSSSSSSSSSSTSSSSIGTVSTSVSAIPSLSLTSTLTSTNCSLGGTNLLNSITIGGDTTSSLHSSPSIATATTASATTLITTIGGSITPTTAEISTNSKNFKLHQLQQQQLLLVGDSTSLPSTKLHLLKSSSCNLSSTSLATSSSSSSLSSTGSFVSVSPQSIDCCYTQATNVPSSLSTSSSTKYRNTATNHRTNLGSTKKPQNNTQPIQIKNQNNSVDYNGQKDDQNHYQRT